MSELMYQKAKELSEKICGQMEAHLIESIISLFNRGVLVHKVRSPRMSLDQNNFKMTVEAASGVSFEGREVIVQLETELAQLREKCVDYEKALEFYADKKTWGLSGSLHGMRRFMSLQNWGPPMTDFDVYLQPNIAGYANEPKELKYEIGGKRAREVLEKWKGKD